MKKRLRIILLRHGQTQGNILKRYTGRRSQEPLTPEAVDSFKKNAREYPNAMYLFTSPALRCQNTAKFIYPRLYPKRKIVDELNEMDFGIFEGKNYQDMKDLPEYREWVDSGCVGQIPGGESREEFIRRTLKGFGIVVDDIEKQHVSQDRLSIKEVKKFTAGLELNEMFDASIVAHGGTIMALLSAFTGEDYFSFSAAPGEGYFFTVEVN